MFIRIILLLQIFEISVLNLRKERPRLCISATLSLNDSLKGDNSAIVYLASE